MTQIGRYEILEELGRGGFSTVYKARDSHLNRLVALKILHESWSNDPEFVRRFRQEAEIVANFRHPNIVVVHDVGEIDRWLFIAMDFLPGEDLQTWLTRRKAPLTVVESLAILEPVADALDYAHKQGAVHRDIKPSNMMIDEQGQARQIVLTDFGLAKAMESSVALTRSGHTLGSPEYMAPEQADPNRQGEIGPHTDRYSFGIVAYQMLAGRVPFPGNSISTLNAHANLPVPLPQEFNRTLPDSVTAVLLKMLAKDPAERYPSAVAFIDVLRKTTLIDSQVEVAELYTQLLDAQSKGAWVEVLSLAIRVETLQPGYRDVLKWQAEARYQLTRPETDPAPEAEAPVEIPVPPKAGATSGEPLTPPSSQPVETDVEPPSEVDDGPVRRKNRVYILGIVGVLVAIGLIVGLVAVAASLGSDQGEGQDGMADAPPSNASLGDTWTRPADDMVMVYVPAGRFSMGSDQGDDDEQPVHEVRLDAFWIDQTEVTNAQYNRCVAGGECGTPFYWYDEDFSGDEWPVVGVDWGAAEAYCAWAGGQLPTEAQWEYAARGEDGSLYPWGDEFDCGRANVLECETYEFTAPAGSYPDGTSWAGAHDMAGNVSEWVADWYDLEYYSDSPLQNPSGPSSGVWRVLRGGSWDRKSWNAQSATRSLSEPGNFPNNIGFRCAAPGP